jgi:hypothetical protein
MVSSEWYGKAAGENPKGTNACVEQPISAEDRWNNESQGERMAIIHGETTTKRETGQRLSWSHHYPAGLRFDHTRVLSMSRFTWHEAAVDARK